MAMKVLQRVARPLGQRGFSTNPILQGMCDFEIFVHNTQGFVVVMDTQEFGYVLWTLPYSCTPDPSWR